MNVYEKCPVIENDDFKVRLIQVDDVDGLWKVYSDKHALPYFNSDHCNGSNFYCAVREHMEGAIKFWLLEYYENKGFVRFTIVDKKTKEAIGTIEMFRRKSEDCYNGYGLLRVDVRSDYEEKDPLHSILTLVTEPFYEWFACESIATKAANYAVNRIEALEAAGYKKSEEPLIGLNPTREYYGYFVKSRK